MATSLENNISEFLRAIYSLQDEQSLSETILSGLFKLIPGDNAIVGRHRPSSRQALQLRLLRPFVRKSFLEELAISGAAVEHPIWHPSPGDPFGFKCLSSMMSRKQWESHPLYCDFLRHDDVHDHITLDLRNPSGVFTMIGVIRSKRGFTREECSLLQLLGPHFTQAFHNAEFFQTENAEGAGSDEHAPAHIRWGPFRNLNELREWHRARHSFWNSIAGGRKDSYDDKSFSAWCQRQMDWLFRGGPERGLHPLRMEGRGGVLKLAMARNWDGNGVFLIESRLPLHPAEDPFQLTSREKELLHWVREGKTDPEISIILNLSLHTVKGYLKAIYRKLGARNRTEAARMAERAGGTGHV